MKTPVKVKKRTKTSTQSEKDDNTSVERLSRDSSISCSGSSISNGILPSDAHLPSSAEGSRNSSATSTAKRRVSQTEFKSKKRTPLGPRTVGEKQGTIGEQSKEAKKPRLSKDSKLKDFDNNIATSSPVSFSIFLSNDQETPETSTPKVCPISPKSLATTTAEIKPLEEVDTVSSTEQVGNNQLICN